MKFLFKKNHWIKRGATFLLLFILFIPMALAVRVFPGPLENSLKARQDSVVYTFNELDKRINTMDDKDPRKEHAKDLLKDAEDAKNDFNDLDPEDFVNDDDEPIVDENGVSKLVEFDNAEKLVVARMNAVNLAILMPVQPGASKFGEAGTVPSGSLTGDFIPGLIRLLFRFLSVAILISFVVSGVFFVIAFDKEEYITKAKTMLYYSLTGFAVVVLAYAIVKAITNINFFGII